ncbi:hypothetical protein FOG51_03225 [Hanseniaspora uvarum]|jgi:hypothetical protein|uniref:Uncharacterized protein n=1 Tax=Hanseniaspora uvarum TaxID=29833 RepID=A0A1E5RUZ4_HANUV|nr:hypothetical protein FOG48_01541 [Hanseniaspora uvarum]KAF0271844.1 hypothetical protein FOG51_03225 [Hanseniaspora uvarum]KAF0277737.1 hypothetical protein FOG50_01427 [Hanseniaspora uvarum]OEJ90588.1 hypothetical protein AWRI3580_g1242 [Hanseniaspora uvarum]GMM41798.1 hypothetical protein DAHU10_027080 [Hanseniaspora uvarum]
MANSFHLNLLRQYYQFERDSSLENFIKVEVHEDNILRYDYSILPSIQKGEIYIKYMDDDTVQIKCSHLNQGKPETLFFKYDPYKPSTENFSIKDVVDNISKLSKKNNKKHRHDSSSEETKDECEIYYNQLLKRRKFCKEF